MSLRGLVVFGAGYVLGTRAGRERYTQIAEAASKAATRLAAAQQAKGGGEPTMRLSDYLSAPSGNGARRS